MLGKKLKWSAQSISMYFSWAVIGYVTYYSTDILGLNAGIIGTLILLSKILDAITNFIAATIVDSHRFKKGKGRPWAICIIPMWVSIILMFSIPKEWGDTAKYIMIFLMYSIINAVFATVIQCVEQIYLKHAFLKEKERVSISNIAGGLGTISMTIGTIVMPMLISYFDTIEHGWTIMTAAIGIPMALIGSIRYLTIPEVDTNVNDPVERVTLKDTLQAFFSNKYTILIMFMNMALQIASNITSAPTTYYFKYIVGDISLQSIAGMMAIPAMLILIVLPKLAEKFGRVKVIRVGMIVAIISSCALFFANDNVPFFSVMALIGTAAKMPLTIFNGLMLIDSMEYDKLKNNREQEAAVFAGTSLGTTIGNGLGASLSGLFLNAFGYDGSLAVQSDFTIFGIKASVSFLPAVFFLIIFILLAFYDLDKKLSKLREEKNADKEIEA